MLEAIELDSEEANINQKKGMKKMLETIRDNIKNEISPQILHNDNELTSLDEMVELGMQEHQQNISQIDQILEEKFSSLN
jgi:hypothetical protein